MKRLNYQSTSPEILLSSAFIHVHLRLSVAHQLLDLSVPNLSQPVEQSAGIESRYRIRGEFLQPPSLLMYTPQ